MWSRLSGSWLRNVFITGLTSTFAKSKWNYEHPQGLKVKRRGTKQAGAPLEKCCEPSFLLIMFFNYHYTPPLIRFHQERANPINRGGSVLGVARQQQRQRSTNEMQSSCSDSLYSWEVTRSQCEAARYVNKVHVYKQLAQNETCGTSAAQEMTPVNMQSSLKGVFAHKCETLASEAQCIDSKRRYKEYCSGCGKVLWEKPTTP